MNVLVPGSILVASSGDGLASWRSFVRGFEAHVSGQQSLLPLIGIGAALLGVLWLNFWVARRLLGGGGKPGSAQKPG